jgi:hypothetical protein
MAEQSLDLCAVHTDGNITNRFAKHDLVVSRSRVRGARNHKATATTTATERPRGRRGSTNEPQHRPEAEKPTC